MNEPNLLDTAPHICPIPLENLRAHPMNANAMSDAMLDKLTAHMRRGGRYPPLIVRPMPGDPDESTGLYQLLDGHHRWAALNRIGHTHAHCVIWDVDDEQAAILMATLNRLEGHDDPHRRAALVGELHERFERTVKQLGDLLPESTHEVDKLLALRRETPRPAAPKPLSDMPAAVHFFLSGEDRQRLNTALKHIGGPRERALMHMVQEIEPHA